MKDFNVDEALGLHKELQKHIQNGSEIPADLQARWDSLISQAKIRQAQLSEEEIEKRNDLMKQIVSELK